MKISKTFSLLLLLTLYGTDKALNQWDIPTEFHPPLIYPGDLEETELESDDVIDDEEDNYEFDDEDLEDENLDDVEDFE